MTSLREGGTSGFAFSASPPRFAVAGGWLSHEKPLPPADVEAMAWAASSLPSDKSRFICIYPAYINNKKTIAEGRRIPLDKAVENPTSTEIQDVCAAVGLNVLLEKNKMYPREWNRDAQYRGRVRIQLKQEDGNPCQPQFPTRKAVMLYAAETIPKLKTRTQKMGGSDPCLQQGEGGKKNKGKKKK
ncbi:signal recognition particle 19 kDa protein isoform 2-T2 [Liasis olivaceus]